MPDDDARKAILARRARFVAAAIASAGLAGAAMQACGGKEAAVCLSMPPPDAGTDDASSEPQACLKVAPDATTDDAAADPQACLSPPWDAGADDAAAEPQVCLGPPQPDSGPDDVETDPQACLKVAPDGDTQG